MDYSYLKKSEVIKRGDEFELLSSPDTWIVCDGVVGNKRGDLDGGPRVRRPQKSKEVSKTSHNTQKAQSVKKSD